MVERLQEALQEIKRGCSEIIGEDYIINLVKNFLQTNERFILKAGFDPTAPDLHLGHSVLLRKLATLQKYGAQVYFLIGDFTARIGDPTGKNQTRKPLSKTQIQENAKTYQNQVFKLLDPKYTQVVFNSQWLNELSSVEMIELISKFSVARMLERDDFAKRYSQNQSISLVEFIYPLLQGYDSVVLKSDLELGGNDQKFNLLVGRILQRSYGIQKEQSIIMMPLLEGLDGVQKMSKSLDNYIGITEDPTQMYAKLLSISDELMWKYYELLSVKTLSEIQNLQNAVRNGIYHPKKAKEDLAHEIVQTYHSVKEADMAKTNFELVFSKNEIPQDLPVFFFHAGIWVCQALKESKLCDSTSQARRDIISGAFRINQQKCDDEHLKLSKGEYIFQIGKRKFSKIIIKG